MSLCTQFRLLQQKARDKGKPQHSIRYSPDAMSHSLASARKQPLEVVRVYALLISSVHLWYRSIITSISTRVTPRGFMRVKC